MTGDAFLTRANIVILFLLAAVVLALYFPVSEFEFLRYDDDAYVTENPYLQNGVAPAVLSWALRTGYLGIWHPLTWISHAIDIELFGFEAGPHHLVAVFLHLVNTLLLFYVLLRFTGRGLESAFVAALFAVHPLHVESVAWISERKDLLSTFFFLLALLAYRRYAEQPRASAYLGVCVFFLLGLMSKPMVVTLPCVLLLLDYWPLNRLTDGTAFKKLVAEKVPLLGLAAACGAVTAYVQNAAGSVKALGLFSLGDRVGNALLSYCAYLGKTVWPADLAVYYPHRAGTMTAPGIAGAVALLAAVTAAAMVQRKRRPYLLVGWLWYLGMLVPVIGIVQVGAQAMADRYTYVPLIGIFIAVVWGVGDWARARPVRAQAMTVAGCIVLGLLSVGAARQLAYWKDTVALFVHDIRVAGPNPIAHAQLGYAFRERGDLVNATPHFEMVVEFQPGSALAYNDLGAVYALSGRFADAEMAFVRTAELAPENARVLVNLADVQLRLGKHDDAVATLRRALTLQPDLADARQLLGEAERQE